MPVYTYRREDGTTFDYRQKFLDDPLTVDPETGQKVVRVVQAASVIFKGSGFYINDSKSASKSSVTSPAKSDTKDNAETKSTEATPAETKSAEAKPAPVASSAAAD
jgi:predicted nucleic acid-binding Zn ribbon protein